MMLHLHLLKLSLLPHCFLVQIGAFVPLSFNGRQGVMPCKIFPGHCRSCQWIDFELHHGRVPPHFS